MAQAIVRHSGRAAAIFDLVRSIVIRAQRSPLFRAYEEFADTRFQHGRLQPALQNLFRSYNHPIPSIQNPIFARLTVPALRRAESGSTAYRSASIR